MKNVKSKSYTVRDDNGNWLAQIVLTDDGFFASVTDYGNLSYAWRAYGKDSDFRKFIAELGIDYFGTKMFTGMSYIVHTKAVEASCHRFAKMILPPFQKMLKEELANNVEW